MTKEAYVSFEVAKLLKEKGFTEECEYFYDWYKESESYHICSNGGTCNNEKYPDEYSMPTHQMAMKWLREVHHIHTEISLYITNPNDIEPKKSRLSPYYTFGVWNTINGNDIDKRLINDFIGNSYEEAVEAALKYSLENLI